MIRNDIGELFPVKQRTLYFNFASDGPLPTTSRDAVINAVTEKSLNGLMAVPKQVAVYENIRKELSFLFRSVEENFAFIKNTSEGVLLALLAMDIKEDENYIVASDAFPTTYCMMESHCRGQVRRVRMTDPAPLVDQLKNVVNNKTRAIVLDWVHYFTGKIIDISSVVQFAKERGILTVIDGIQGAGALKLGLDSSGIDFFVSGGHKWLLSTQGSGFIYVSPHTWEQVSRKAFGWLGYDWQDFSDFSIDACLREGASVMEYGTRSYIAAIAFVESLRLFNDLGIENIERHNRGLREFFEESILKKGYEVIENERSASIVSFKPPRKDVRELGKHLEENNVAVSLRNGYIRAAFHLVNDRGEVEKLIELL